MNYWVWFLQRHKCESERLNIILWFTSILLWKRSRFITQQITWPEHISVQFKNKLKGTTYPSPPPNLTTFIKFLFAHSPDHNSTHFDTQRLRSHGSFCRRWNASGILDAGSTGDREWGRTGRNSDWGGNGFGGVGKAETWETHPCGISPLAASRRVSL